MPVLSIEEIKYMITLHKKISYNFFFLRNFGSGKFSGNFGKFRGNLDWNWGRISAPNLVQKKNTDTERSTDRHYIYITESHCTIYRHIAQICKTFDGDTDPLCTLPYSTEHINILIFVIFTIIFT